MSMILVRLVLIGFSAIMLAAGSAAAPPERGMVLIPAGEFEMGKEAEGSDFSPSHRVRISAFYLDKHEVTNAQWRAFCEATERKLPDFWGMEEFHCGADYPDHPVLGVSWSAARAYAQWCGLRLPTEAEWEYAARGGLLGKNYPSGDEFDSTLYAKSGPLKTVPVGSFAPNDYGVCDMTGNVAEWTSDYYDEEYYQKCPRENPQGPEDGIFRVIRGGGWHTGPWCSRVYVRNALKGNWVDFNVGLRCARHLEGSAAGKVGRVIEDEGIARAVKVYHEISKKQRDDYHFVESEFNDLGYKLLGDERVVDALEIFKLIVEAYPKSSNAHDSLGEVYALSGDRKRAIKAYRKSLKLNPNNAGAKAKLEELEAD